MSDGSPTKSSFGVPKNRYFIAADCGHKTKMVWVCLGGKELCGDCMLKYMNEAMSEVNDCEEQRGLP